MLPRSPNTNFCSQPGSVAAHTAHVLPLLSSKAPKGVFLLPPQSIATSFLPAKVIDFPSPMLKDNVQIVSADLSRGMRHPSCPEPPTGSPSYLPTGSHSFHHFLPKCTNFYVLDTISVCPLAFTIITLPLCGAMSLGTPANTFHFL